MGFDIYGLEPKENKVMPDILNRSWDDFNEEEKKLYWEAKDKWEKENPGIYFRNNVWWWRPLWQYVCEVCEDVMSAEDIGAGGSNSGIEIGEDTVQRMVDKLIIEVALENHVKYQEHYEKELKELPDDPCHYCNETGTRNDEYVKGECNVCKGKGKKRPFACHYPFSSKNVERFLEFLSESGGIEIC